MNSAAEVLEAIASRGLTIYYRDGKLVLNPKSAVSTDLVLAIRRHRDAIVGELCRNDGEPNLPAGPGWIVLWSERLGDYVAVVYDPRLIVLAQKELPGVLIFTPDEIGVLRHLVERDDYDELIANVCAVKREFPGARAVEAIAPVAAEA